MFHIEDSAAIVAINGYVAIAAGMLPKGWSKKFLPLVSIVCGIGYAFLVKPNNVAGVGETLLLGLVLGVTAVGAHSAVKNGAQKLAAGKKKKS